jgi:hypothetical protein
MRLNRPELKMPDLKVPPFLADVYYDLRDRRLLPLIALVVVAILTVPFLLGGDTEESPPPLADGTGTAAVGETGDASLTVVEARPGLRDYRKRLRNRTPADPFEQRYTGVPEESQLKSVETQSSAVSGGGSTEITATETEVTAAPEGADAPQDAPQGSGGGGGSAGEGAGSGKAGGPRLFGFRPDVRFGVAGSDDLSLHNELPFGSFLPKRDPVLVFIGVTQNGKRSLFDVSPEVSMVQGDGDCVGGKRNCRILSLQAGQAVSLLMESANRAFRLAVVRIDFVELDLPRKASSSTDTEPRAAGLLQSFNK